MAFAFLLIFAIFALPIGLYIWHVAVRVPAAGRARQEQTWRPLAERLGGHFAPSTGGARFHAMTIPFGATQVTCLVFDRAAHDPALSSMRTEVGGWRTFVQAPVPERRGVALAIEPRHKWSSPKFSSGHPALDAQHVFAPLLGTQPYAVTNRITPDLAHALTVLGPRYDYVQAGPAFVSLELPGICQDPQVLEAAVRIVGALAQPAADAIAIAR
jgi:hypothetical protein